ncbi:MAG: PorP/SprF family type IX secretion system membrane protein [Cytophagales bacterium]|nr:PorP/SprF family type IX secretion system membrane protein [Cytophagales bacterium]
MKKGIIGLLLILAFHAGWGQALEQYSQFATNMYLFNPAALSLDYGLNLAVGGKKQWAGFGHAPENYYLMVYGNLNDEMPKDYNVGSMPIGVPHENLKVKSTLKPERNVVSLGGFIDYAESGAFRFINSQMKVSLSIPYGERWRVAFGARTGIISVRLVTARASTLLDPNDPTYQQYVRRFEGRGVWEYGAGVMVFDSNIKFGYSLSNQPARALATNNSAKDDYRFHHTFIASYKYNLDESFYLLAGGHMEIRAPEPIFYQFSLNCYYNDFINAGGGFQADDQWVVMLGIKLANSLHLGYSFGMLNNSIKTDSHGSHEAIIKYKF